MKYFYDTEFLEGPQTIRLFGINRNVFFLLTAMVLSIIASVLLFFYSRNLIQLPLPATVWTTGAIFLLIGTFSASETNPTIDLISIGMVSEAGNRFYAISNEFNIREAWNRYDIVNGERVYWIRENVLMPIYKEFVVGDMRNHLPFTIKTMKKVIEINGHSKNEIGKQVVSFIDRHNSVSKPDKIELYGYYSAYDHVAFCWLFGKMIDLPYGIPMYTKDLKQMIDDKVGNVIKDGVYLTLSEIKNMPDYPKESNAHNALSDATWNMDLYKFIISI